MKEEPDVNTRKDRILMWLPDFIVKLGIDIMVYLSYNLKMSFKCFGFEYDHSAQVFTRFIDFEAENVYFPMDQSKRCVFSVCIHQPRNFVKIDENNQIFVKK